MISGIFSYIMDIMLHPDGKSHVRIPVPYQFGIQRYCETACQTAQEDKRFLPYNGCRIRCLAPRGWRDREFARLVERAVETLPLLAAERGSQLTEANIEKLLEVLLSDAPRGRVETELEIDNARLRSEYLRETPLLTGAEVNAASGLHPREQERARLPLGNERVSCLPCAPGALISTQPFSFLMAFRDRS